jgi:integrase
MILDLAVADRRLAVNPATGVTQPRLPIQEMRFLSTAELDRLCAEMPGERDEILTLLLGWTGLRFGEAAALRRGDLDLLRRRIRIERAVSDVHGRLLVGSPKTHQARMIAVPGSVADRLGAYMNELEGDVLFPSAAGGHLSVTNWKRRVFDPAAARAGLTPPPLRVHDLRHTAAALAIASGASVKALQRQLGHRSATLTLDTYGHLWPDELDGLVEALDDLRRRLPADSLRTVLPNSEVVALPARL